MADRELRNGVLESIINKPRNIFGKYVQKHTFSLENFHVYSLHLFPYMSCNAKSFYIFEVVFSFYEIFANLRRLYVKD